MKLRKQSKQKPEKEYKPLLLKQTLKVMLHEQEQQDIYHLRCMLALVPGPYFAFVWTGWECPETDLQKTAPSHSHEQLWSIFIVKIV